MEILLQFVIPFFIFGTYIALTVKILLMKRSNLNKTEIAILKQAFTIFFLFEISSLIFIFCQTLEFNTSIAFLVKRIINTIEIFAGAATPCFFFSTCKDIKKLISSKVSQSVTSSSSNSQARRQTRSL
uniref:Uncharacterized protein n=1 Tax=Caenorhabditis japonica TaxID=281687 RepID=A0A8R1E5L0_CAEJA